MSAKIKTTIGSLFSELITLNVITYPAKERLFKACHNARTGYTDYAAKVELVRSLGMVIINVSNKSIDSDTELILLIPDHLISKLMDVEDMPVVTGCRSIWSG